MDNKVDTPIKSIRAKCLDCTNGSHKEIRLCTVIDCPLYPYRFGKRPTSSIISTINSYFEEKHEPSTESFAKKGTLV